MFKRDLYSLDKGHLVLILGSFDGNWTNEAELKGIYIADL